jgi:MFS transporter, AAHS family, benzoate transport protein
MSTRPLPVLSARRVLFLGFLILSIDGYDMFTLGTVGPALLAYAPWGATAATLGTLAAVTGLGMPIGSTLAGWLSDRTGRRLPIVVAVGLISMAMLLAAIAPNVVVFGIARFATGIAIGGLSPLVAALVSDHAPPSSRTLYLAVAYAAYGAGGAGSAFLGAVLLTHTHFQWLFLPGLLPLLLLWPLWRVLPAGRPVVDPARASGEAISAPGPGELFAVPLRRATLLLWAAAFLSLALIYSTSTWLPTVLLRNGYAMTSALQFTAAFILGASLGSVGLALLADRGHLRAVTVGGFAAAAVVLALLPLAREQSTLVVLLLCALAGVGSLAGQALVVACMVDLYPARLRGTAIGFGQGFGRLGAIVGPAYLAVMTTVLATPHAGFFAFALIAVLGALAIALLPRRRTGEVGPATRAQGPLSSAARPPAQRTT